MADELPEIPEGFQLHQPDPVETKSDLPDMPEGFQAQSDKSEAPHEESPRTAQKNWH